MRFKGKVVLVTGSGVGIGRATALAYAREGALVVVNLQSARTGAETLGLLVAEGHEALFVQGDISSVADAQRLVNETVRRFSRLDVLVNNAGVVLPGRVDTISEDDWVRTFEVNVKGTYLVSRYAIAAMRQCGGGVIVNVASLAGERGVPDRAAYSASKGALLSLTRAMARDYLAENIRVNSVSPGMVMTPSLEQRLQAFPDPEKARAEFMARQPMGRFGLEQEIAAAILFASCDEAAFMTGENISINGGKTL